MFRCGLLVISPCLQRSSIISLLSSAHNIVSDKLFLKFMQSPKNLDFWKTATTVYYNTASEVISLINLIIQICPLLNVYILHPDSSFSISNFKLDIVMSREAEFTRDVLVNEAKKLDPNYRDDIAVICKKFDKNEKELQLNSSHQNEYHKFLEVCLGGTFDRIHCAHKVLLTIGAILAQQRLTIGLMCSNKVSNKILSPLILTWEKRREDVKDFLLNIGFQSELFDIVKLNDSYGPPGESPNFDCIISSPESVTNCQKLNEHRLSKGFKPLHIETIDYVELNDLDIQKCKNNLPVEFNELKVSSTASRFALLGSLLKPPNTLNVTDSKLEQYRPYVIGLVGPSCSGKSTLTNTLMELSANVHIVNCDQLGQNAYTPGTQCYQTILRHFGQDKIASPIPPHPIDRSKLGAIVFSDIEKLKALNEIVWPEIYSQVCRIIDELTEQSRNKFDAEGSFVRQIVVMDAAVLLQAGWDKCCNEIWLTVLPKEDCVRRLCERNGLGRDHALERVNRQAESVAQTYAGFDWFTPGQMQSSIGPIDRAHVIFSSQWELEFTKKQIEKAWSELLKRIPSSTL